MFCSCGGSSYSKNRKCSPPHIDIYTHTVLQCIWDLLLYRRHRKEYTSKEMFLLLLLLPLSAILQQSLGEYPGIATDLPEKIQKEIVDKFNAIRRGVQPSASNMVKMKWSDKAADNAKIWARKCIARAAPQEERFVDGVLCGDNRVRSTYSTSWLEVIDLWNQKSSNFKYGVGAIDPRRDIYGYTQMIWHNSYLIGCTVAFCPAEEYKFLYVCRFCPAGNSIEEIATPYKEGPPCGDCLDNCEDGLCTQTCEYMDAREDCKTMVLMFPCENVYIQQVCAGTCKCPPGLV
ncbi:cysteine-rich venom protein piscivorin isoform X1 [Anolis carolinensis]